MERSDKALIHFRFSNKLCDCFMNGGLIAKNKLLMFIILHKIQLRFCANRMFDLHAQ